MTAVAYAGGDGGARQTVAAVAEKLPGIVFEPRHADREHLTDTLTLHRIGLVITGTSDSEAGRAFEDAVKAAATSSAVPIVQIEDYPGNFRPTRGTRCDLLIADGAFARDLAAQRWGPNSPSCIAVPTPRYDALRRNAKPAPSHKPTSSKWVLWAGQPETEDSFLTLARVLPHIVESGHALLFRAHPRDMGYRNGAYQELFERSGGSMRDATAMEWDQCLREAPRLLMTQFSSLAVEFGFRGIPTMHLLYPDAGGARLLNKKGYAVPPWCQDGASLLITQVGTEAAMIRSALNDQDLRAAVQSAFAARFRKECQAAIIIVKHLYNLGLIDALPTS